MTINKLFKRRNKSPKQDIGFDEKLDSRIMPEEKFKKLPPLEGAYVILFHNGEKIEELLTDDDGLYKFYLNEAEQYRIVILNEIKIIEGDVRFDVMEVETEVIEEWKPKYLRNKLLATIIANENDKMIHNAQVVIKQKSQFGEIVLDSVYTNANGRVKYYLKTNGEYVISATHDHYYPQVRNISTHKMDGIENLDVPFNLEIKKIVRVVGYVMNVKKPLHRSLVKLYTGKKLSTSTYTTKKGFFNFELEVGEQYSVAASMEGFFSKIVTITTEGREHQDTISLNMLLERVLLNKRVKIEDIYYDYNKWNIRTDAALELDKLVDFLNMNASVVIELSSHTDSRGDPDFNLTLSQKRAKSAVDYLISKKISRSRLVPRGYGELMLMVKNAKSEEQHQKNRRTEFKVIKIKKENTDIGKE